MYILQYTTYHVEVVAVLLGGSSYLLRKVTQEGSMFFIHKGRMLYISHRLAPQIKITMYP
jgi:hypothetical protein